MSSKIRKVDSTLESASILRIVSSNTTTGNRNGRVNTCLGAWSGKNNFRHFPKLARSRTSLNAKKVGKDSTIIQVFKDEQEVARQAYNPATAGSQVQILSPQPIFLKKRPFLAKNHLTPRNFRTALQFQQNLRFTVVYCGALWSKTK